MRKYRLDDFIKLCSSLLPSGFIWRVLYGNILFRFFKGISYELERIQLEIENLFYIESYPEKSVCNVIEWCNEFGITPKLAETEADLRKLIHARRLANGYPNEEYWKQFGSRLGYGVTVEQLTPPDHSCPEYVLHTDAPIEYKMAVAGDTYAGESTVNVLDSFALRIKGQAEDLKHAHNKVHFGFSEYSLVEG